MEYDSNFDGTSKVCYDIMLNIEKNTLSQDELYIAKHEFDTIINTLKFVEYLKALNLNSRLYFYSFFYFFY